MAKVRWMGKPQDHDYAAAERYLTLLMSPDAAQRRRLLLESAERSHGHHPPVTYPAKDILRASGLPLLPADNEHVAADLAKVRADEELSPVLLLRGKPLVIADGYHRVCAAYHADENTDVPVVITLWLSGSATVPPGRSRWPGCGCSPARRTR